MSQALSIMRIVFGMAFLCYASYTDIKVRRVKNEVWLGMALIGGILLLLQLFLDKKGWEYFLIFIPVTILFASMFFEHAPLYDPEKKAFNFKITVLVIIGMVAVVYQFNALYGDRYYYKLLAIPVLITLFYILYQTGILHGGADAKALMAIAVFVPFYPVLFDFPILEFANERVASAMEVFFPFALLVLMNAALFLIWLLVALLIYNAAKGNFGLPEMLLGYKMDIDDVNTKHVWPMERMMQEERVMVLFPKKTDFESLKKLKELGVKRIWVTPKIPFIVAITAGFFISAFVGNVFAAIFGMVG